MAMWWTLCLQDNAACVLTEKLHHCVQHRQAFAKWEHVEFEVGATQASKVCGDEQAAHVDSVDLLIMDVESSLGELLLPGIKTLQVAFIVTHEAALQHSPLIHSFMHTFTMCLAPRSGAYSSE